MNLDKYMTKGGTNGYCRNIPMIGADLMPSIGRAVHEFLKTKFAPVTKELLFCAVVNLLKSEDVSYKNCCDMLGGHLSFQFSSLTHDERVKIALGIEGLSEKEKGKRRA